MGSAMREFEGCLNDVDTCLGSLATGIEDARVESECEVVTVPVVAQRE